MQGPTLCQTSALVQDARVFVCAFKNLLICHVILAAMKRDPFYLWNTIDRNTCSINCSISRCYPLNISRPIQGGCPFSDTIFKHIFVIDNLNVWLSIKISPKFIFRVENRMGSDNGLALNRWQAVIWTNDDIIYWCHSLRTYLYQDNINRHRHCYYNCNTFAIIFCRVDSFESIVYRIGDILF